MKKTIERLKQALELISGNWYVTREEIERVVTIRDCIKAALAELKTPRYYTPEQWEADTGEKWPDNRYVWIRTSYTAEELGRDVEDWYAWEAYPYGFVRKMGCAEGKTVVCVTAPEPPPDDWRPEEHK
jgi:hypothetical protein